MQIQKALPIERYVKAVKHSQTPEFRARVKEAVTTIQEWVSDPKVNKKVLPNLWCGCGKDSSTVAVLLKKAKIDFSVCFLDNQGDLPCHYEFVPEFKAWLDLPADRWLTFKTEKRVVDYRYELRGWGRENGVYKKNGDEIDFFDLGSLEETYRYFTEERFYWSYSSANRVLYFNGVRAGEGMERAFDISTNGLFQAFDYGADAQPSSAFKGLPIGRWKDLDVWALLVSEDVPVSPVYSMHEVAQKAGRGAFPRTLWYSDPRLFSTQYYRWLAYYAPAQLKELLQLFPEIHQRFKPPQKKELAS